MNSINDPQPENTGVVLFNHEATGTNLSSTINVDGIFIPDAHLHDSELSIQDKRNIGKSLRNHTKYVPPEFISVRKGTQGKWFCYIEGDAVSDLLDSIFGMNWTFALDERWITNESCDVRGTLTILGTSRSDCGCQPVKKYQETGEMMAVDMFKGAVTDCLKRCARLFGVAAELYAGNNAPANDTYINFIEYLLRYRLNKLKGVAEFDKLRKSTPSETKQAVTTWIESLETINDIRDKINNIMNLS